MFCRLIVTCALLGHVVLSLPAARAPRYTPLPDEVDSDETRRVLGSSVVTSVSVIMDLGNGSQALFSEPSGDHYSYGKPDPSADNLLSPEKRPVGSPPALLSPDRYEFYTFDESGELVRRLMTLEQIQSLIAGGDDANRIAAIPLDVEIDTVPSPQATDPQGQVVANVQQVLAEELLASTKKNGTEPHETELEVEAEVQEVPPPPSSPKPEQEEEQSNTKVSTEAAPEPEEPTVASTAQMSTEAPPSTATVASTSAEEHAKPEEDLSLSTEGASQAETDLNLMDETTKGPAESEASSTASTALEEESAQEAAENDDVKDTQMPIEAVTEEADMSEDQQTHLQTSTEKQEEIHENVPSLPSESTSHSDDMDEVKDSASTEATSEGTMELLDDTLSETATKPEIEVQEGEKVSEAPTQVVSEEEPEFKLTTPLGEFSQESEEKKPTEAPNQSNAESEEISIESELSNKNPPLLQTDDQSPSENMPVDESSMTTLMEPSSEVLPSESSDHIVGENSPSSVASTPSVETSSNDKDAVDDIMSTGIIMADVEDIPSSPIPSDSQILEEADLSGVSEEIPPSVPAYEGKPDEPVSPFAENGITVVENSAVPDLEAVLPEMPTSPESEPEMPQMIPTEIDDQEDIPATPVQSEAEEGDGNKDEVEESDDDDESLLDQLAESVSSVLSQVTDLDDEEDDDFKKETDPPVTEFSSTQQPQNAVPADAGVQLGAEDAGDEIEQEAEGVVPDAESILPDMRDPTKDAAHVVAPGEEGEIATPAPADVNKVDDMPEPGDHSEVKVPMTEEAEEGGDSQMEEDDDSVLKVPTTASSVSVQGTLAPLTITESYEEFSLSVEGNEPSLSPEEAPTTTEESKKESEPAQIDNEPDASEKESESTVASPTEFEKVDLLNIEDLENVQAVLAEEEESKETEVPQISSTESSEIIHLSMEDDLVKESSNETSESVDDTKPSEDDKSEEEKVEVISISAIESTEGYDVMTTKSTPVEEDGMKEEEVKVEETTTEKYEVEEEMESQSEGMTTEQSAVATTEMYEMQEVEKDQTTAHPTEAPEDHKIPGEQSVEDSSLEEAEAVKGVPEDHVLLENLHKEAEKESDPLLEGDKHTTEDSTNKSTKIQETTTVSNHLESSSVESSDEGGLVKGDVTTSSPVDLDETHQSDEAEETKPSNASAAVEQEVKGTETPSPQLEVEAETTKATVVTDIEQVVDSSSSEPSKNPWTSIPIPLRPQDSTTLESNKQPTSYPPTPSTTGHDLLSLSSASPDDLPYPNGLSPLLTEKPGKPANFKPYDVPLSSSTDIPSSTRSPSTTAGTSTTVTAAPAVTPGGAVVPPLMPAFPQAPEGNVGLEATSASTESDVKRFVDLCNDLAFALYGQVTSGAGASSVPATRGANGGGVQTRSLVVSPFAITSLLAMVFLGARGPTSEEMNDLLRLDDMVTFNPHLVLQNVTDAVITSPGVSAAAFVRELYSDKSNGKLLEFYKARAKAFYDGHVEEVDFKEVNDVIRRRTNHLVRWQTRGRVPEYLRGSSLKLRPPLAALSANFFEADCQRASSIGTDGEMYFEMPATGRRRRRLVPVPAVVWRGVFLAGHDPGLDATVLELRHGGGEVSTVLVLPGRHGHSIDAADVSGGLTRLENWLINGGRESWSALLRSALPRGPLEVQLPRFAHRSVLNATGALSRMGLQHLFQDGKADLGGLDGGLGGKLHLADVIQMTAFGVCADDGNSKRHLETYPSAQRTGRKHRRSLPIELEEESPEELSEEAAETSREGKSGWMDELAREEDDSYVFAAAAAARELPLALRPRQARIPRPGVTQQHTRVVLPRLRYDRPFLYFVRHNPSGFILLMGRFNPRLFP